MKKTIFFTVMALLCLNFSIIQKIYAQQKEAMINAKPLPLRLGDKLPDSFWEQKHTISQNGQLRTESLAVNKKKLIILDFWATWCGSCLKKFAMADSLQKEYGDGIAIILVNAANTRDTEDKIKPVLQRYETALPSIIGDTTLTRMFPHAVIPHYIWIEQGQYRAATGTEFFTREGLAASVDRRKYLTKLLKELNEKLK